MADDDDPVIASYDVCLTGAATPGARELSSKLLLLQYPSHRPYSEPYNAARSQAPTSLRMKPNTGLLEVDIPMLTHEHYNRDTGERYGKITSESRTIHAGGTHGLAGGFATGANLPRLRDIPLHGATDSPTPTLNLQTLGGKVIPPNARDPIYLVGCFHNDKLHLSHLDAVVQMRPQLHHIDAEEELSQKRFQPGNSTSLSRQKPGLESSAPKVESKAIEIKIRDSKEDAKDRGLNENARQLRNIQVDEWEHHDWVDEDHIDAEAAFNAHMVLGVDGGPSVSRLQSAISNGDWLDKMSAPREDGKKGLLAKLRGRERERARRKKAEEEKRQRQKEATKAHGLLLGMSSDSELSSPEVSDSDGPEEGVKSTNKADQVQIKVEIPPAAAPSRGLGSSPPAQTSVPKKRGRPRKNQPPEPIAIED